MQAGREHCMYMQDIHISQPFKRLVPIYIYIYIVSLQWGDLENTERTSPEWLVYLLEMLPYWTIAIASYTKSSIYLAD